LLVLTGARFWSQKDVVTGQNPASGAAAAEAVLKELAARA
jgi:putative intracellular protease/amidase